MTIYLLMNLFLIISFLMFMSLRIGDFCHRQRIHIGQVLICLSLLLPAASQLIPKQHLLKIHFGTFTPSIEADFSLLGHQNKKVSQASQKEANSEQSKSNISQLSRVDEKTIFLLFFLVGLMASFSYFMINIKKLNSILMASIPFRRMGKVHIVLSEAITIPFSVRLGFKSWVVIPMTMLENSSDFRLAIKHEIQHHRQGDTSWAIWAELLTCFFSINPAIYFFKREIIKLQEYSCDEALVGKSGISVHDYGNCLIRVAEIALKSRQMYVGTACMAIIFRKSAHQKSFLRRRISLLMARKENTRTRLNRLVGGFVGVLAMMSLMVVACISQPSSLSKINPGLANVDDAIQKIAEKILAEGLKKAKAKKGFVIVANPNNGVILAIANIDTEKKTFDHWSLGLTFQPASTLKTIVTAQALESHLTDSQDLHNCEKGKYLYHGKIYDDWKEEGWESLSTEDIIAYSSNIGAIKIAEKLGVNKISHLLPNFGFGPGGTASSFPEAVSGVLPLVEVGNTEDVNHLIPHVAEGSSFLISPIELLQAYGAIANGGKLMMPQLVTNSLPLQEGHVIRKVLTLESSEKMKTILQQVVLKGTAKDRANSSLYTTAGKTGSLDTSEIGNMASFIGFAPVKKPQIEVYVGVINPQENAHGASQAAPIFKQVVEEVLSYLNIVPDKKN